MRRINEIVQKSANSSSGASKKSKAKYSLMAIFNPLKGPQIKLELPKGVGGSRKRGGRIGEGEGAERKDGREKVRCVAKSEKSSNE